MQVCPFHADEGIVGVPVGSDGTLSFTCDRTRGHPTPGLHIWVVVPAPPELDGMSGLGAELGLHVELPALISQFGSRWVEFGVVEHAYAHARPDDFAMLVARYSHTAIAASRYTVSAFIARTLGDLSKWGNVLFHDGPATGRWAYNSRISWWSVAPEPDWETARLSWADTGLTMDYVPGSVE